MNHTLKRRGLAALIVVGALVALYALAGFLLAPYVIERTLPGVAERFSGRAAVADVDVNPFLLALVARDVRLGTEDGSPILAVDRAVVDLQWSSLFRWAWTFREVTLQGVDLRVEIGPDGRLNLASLGGRDGSARSDARGLPRIVLRHASIEDGMVTFADRSIEPPASATVRDLDLEVRDLSTLPDGSGRYALRATLPAGGGLVWRGTMSPHPFESQGELAVSGLNLATPWRFVRAAPGLAAPEGRVDLSAEYRFAYGDGKLAFALDGIEARAKGFALQERAGADAPALKLASVSVRGGSFDLAGRKLVLPVVELAEGQLLLTRDAQGDLNWQQAFAAAPEQSKGATKTKPSRAAEPWQVALQGVRLDDVDVRYVDRSRIRPVEIDLGGVSGGLALSVQAGAGATTLAARELDLSAGQVLVRQATGESAPALALDTLALRSGRFDFPARALVLPQVELKGGRVRVARARDGTIDWQQLFSAAGSAASGAGAEPATAGEGWQVALEAVRVEGVGPHYADYSRRIPYAVDVGALNTGLEVTVSTGGDSTEVAAGAESLQLGKVQLTDLATKQVLASVQSAALSNARLNTAERLLAVRSGKLSGGSAMLVRNERETIRLLDMFAASDAAAGAEPASRAGRPWRYRVETLDARDIDLRLADRSFEPPIRYDMALRAATLENLDTQSASPVSFRAAAQLAQGGKIDASGTFATRQAAGSILVEAAGVDLVPLQPLLSRYAEVQLRSGSASGSVRTRYGAKSGRGPLLTGAWTIASVAIVASRTGERVIAWKTLSAEGFELSFADKRLAIDEVRVVEPEGKLEISRDRTLNVARLLRAQDQANGVPAATQPAPQAEQPARFAVELKRVRVQNGVLDFADESLVIPFAARIVDLDGSMVGISTRPKIHAELVARGKISPYGSARARGTINVFAPKQYTDLRVQFNNVDMPRLSPYTVTFAGYSVAAGKLWLDLQYKIVDGELAGSNDIRLDDFVLGERVESPSALDLPIELAIAVLKDEQGRIDIAVPVRGDLDNPEFDYGSVIREALASVLRRVVTAPFRFLGRLFGAQGEELARIEFRPGSARLAPEQQEKLNTVAQALGERPQLALVVQPAYDPQRDPIALGRRAVRAALAQALGDEPDGDGGALPLAFGDGRTQRALERLYERRAGRGAMRAFEREYEQRQGRAVRRVSFFRGASEDVEFYRALFEQLAQLHAPSEAELQQLAQRRAQAIAEYLAAAGIDTKRVDIAPARAARSRDEAGIAVELELRPRQSA